MKVLFRDAGQNRQKTFYKGSENTWKSELKRMCGGVMPVTFTITDSSWGVPQKRSFVRVTPKDEEEIKALVSTLKI